MIISSARAGRLDQCDGVVSDILHHVDRAGIHIQNDVVSVVFILMYQNSS